MTAAAAAGYRAPFDPDTDFDRHYAHATTRRIRPWLRPADRLLELGCATGLMTSGLAPRVAHVDAVERSAEFLERARARGLPNAAFHRGLVEDVELPGRYEQVVAAALLNELADPVALLRRCGAWLAPGGLVHVTMTNPRSLHRLLAVEMGLIDDAGALSTRGSALGTHQITDGPGLERLGAAAGLACVHREPVLLKPFTNAQLEAFGDDVIAGLDRLARLLPEHGAMTYAIFTQEDPVPADLAPAYAPDTDFDRHYTAAAARRIVRWLRPGDTVLELGCATGAMSAGLAARCRWVDGVDVSVAYLRAARERALPNAGFHLGRAEEALAGRYDHVVVASLLGEVDDPGSVLARCARTVGPGGLVHVTTNNPYSLHRLLAMEMGLLDDPSALSALNTVRGVRRVLDADLLAALAAQAGLVELHREDLMAKPLTNAQLEHLPEDVIEGLDRLARHTPGHGAMTYAIFAPPADG